MHEEAHKYKCDTCEMRFSLEWRLNEHIKLHQDKNGRPLTIYKKNAISSTRDKEIELTRS